MSRDIERRARGGKGFFRFFTTVRVCQLSHGKPPPARLANRPADPSPNPAHSSRKQSDVMPWVTRTAGPSNRAKKAAQRT